MKFQSILFIPSHNSSFYLQPERHYQKEPALSISLTTVFSNSLIFLNNFGRGQEEGIVNLLLHLFPEPPAIPLTGLQSLSCAKWHYTSGFANASRYRRYKSFKVCT